MILTIRKGGFSVLRGAQRRAVRWAAGAARRLCPRHEDLTDAAYRELEESVGQPRCGAFGAAGHLRTPDRDPQHQVVSTAYARRRADLPELRGGSDASDARCWPVTDALGHDLGFDDHEILATGAERVRAKLEYSDLALRFVPRCFTMPELQAVYETVWGWSSTRETSPARLLGRSVSCGRRGRRGVAGGGAGETVRGGGRHRTLAADATRLRSRPVYRPWVPTSDRASADKAPGQMQELRA